MEEKKIFYNVDDVAKILGVKQGKAYEVIRKLNFELDEKGYITIRGKIPVAYFRERIYGAEQIA